VVGDNPVRPMEGRAAPRRPPYPPLPESAARNPSSTGIEVML